MSGDFLRRFDVTVLPHPRFGGVHGFWKAGEKGAPTLDARELRRPLNAGCQDARLPCAQRKAAGERRGEGEPELERRAAPSHPL